MMSIDFELNRYSNYLVFNVFFYCTLTKSKYLYWIILAGDCIEIYIDYFKELSSKEQNIFEITWYDVVFTRCKIYGNNTILFAL